MLTHGYSRIYNSRNYYRLLNPEAIVYVIVLSTTVEITIGYLTTKEQTSFTISTTVEITIGYLTPPEKEILAHLQQ